MSESPFEREALALGVDEAFVKAALRDAEGRLLLAASHPEAMYLLADLAVLWGEAPCGVVLTAEADVQAVLNRIFGESVHSGDSVADVLGEDASSMAPPSSAL